MPKLGTYFRFREIADMARLAAGWAG